MSASNERGIIAQLYSDLQSINALSESRKHVPSVRATESSAIKSICQSVEIALWNSGDLMDRITQANDHWLDASEKASWLLGFQRILVQLGTIALKVQRRPSKSLATSTVMESLAYQSFVKRVKDFDQQFLSQFDATAADRDNPIKRKRCPRYQLLHSLRLCFHEMSVWERDLSQVKIPEGEAPYGKYIGESHLYQAFSEPSLKGDTYFTQFRGVHQIPELLSAEINDHLEAVIPLIQKKKFRHAVLLLERAYLLGEGMLLPVQELADRLSTEDYHEIRENLGLTSGSHSVNIHYDFFNDLLLGVWESLEQAVFEHFNHSLAPKELYQKMQMLEESCCDSEASFMLQLLVNHGYQLFQLTHQWRDLHKHLPRNHLGIQAKSLVGADGLRSIESMRQQARRKSRALLKARGFHDAENDLKKKPLNEHFQSHYSLDHWILEQTGKLTQSHFQQVQNREGVFEQKCPFTPPKRRSSSTSEKAHATTD